LYEKFPHIFKQSRTIKQRILDRPHNNLLLDGRYEPICRPLKPKPDIKIVIKVFSKPNFEKRSEKDEG